MTRKNRIVAAVIFMLVLIALVLMDFVLAKPSLIDWFKLPFYLGLALVVLHSLRSTQAPED